MERPIFYVIELTHPSNCERTDNPITQRGTCERVLSTIELVGCFQ
jgi:hypothetical protein